MDATDGRALECTYVRMLGGRQARGQLSPRGSFSQQQYPPGWVYPLQQQHALAPASSYCTRRDLPGIHIAARGIEPLGLGNFALVEFILSFLEAHAKKHPSRREQE